MHLFMKAIEKVKMLDEPLDIESYWVYIIQTTCGKILEVNYTECTMVPGMYRWDGRHRWIQFPKRKYFPDYKKEINK